MRRSPLPLLVAAALATAAALAPAAADDDPGTMLDAAARAYEVATARLAAGAGTVEEVHLWSVRWFDAQRDLPLKGRALAAAAVAHLDRMKELAAKTRSMIDAGATSSSVAPATIYYVLEAERWARRKGRR